MNIIITTFITTHAEDIIFAPLSLVLKAFLLYSKNKKDECAKVFIDYFDGTDD